LEGEFDGGDFGLHEERHVVNQELEGSRPAPRVPEGDNWWMDTAPNEADEEADEVSHGVVPGRYAAEEVGAAAGSQPLSEAIED
jgi:hypothetical protein